MDLRLLRRLAGWEKELLTNKNGMADLAPANIRELRRMLGIGSRDVNEYIAAELRYLKRYSAGLLRVRRSSGLIRPIVYSTE
jgi:hypothetical protein